MLSSCCCTASAASWESLAVLYMSPSSATVRILLAVESDVCYSKAIQTLHSNGEAAYVAMPYAVESEMCM